MRTNKKTCVVLCGGTGSRLLPLSLETQKGMIEVNGKPILGHIIEYWKKYCDDFVFVVKYKKEGVLEYVRRLGLNAKFVEPKELKGIGDAVLDVENLVSDEFILVLGDCICRGEFIMPENMTLGVGVWKTDNKESIQISYSIELKKTYISRVVEKPKSLPNNLCGMGFYFFNRDVFKYIRMTNPTESGNKRGITEVIQTMIDNNEKVHPVFFNGQYLNVTKVEDLEIAKKILI